MSLKDCPFNLFKINLDTDRTNSRQLIRVN